MNTITLIDSYRRNISSLMTKIVYTLAIIFTFVFLANTHFINLMRFFWFAFILLFHRRSFSPPECKWANFYGFRFYWEIQFCVVCVLSGSSAIIECVCRIELCAIMLKRQRFDVAHKEFEGKQFQSVLCLLFLFVCHRNHIAHHCHV